MGPTFFKCFLFYKLTDLNGEKLASPGCDTLKRSVVDGKVLQVSPSLQPSLQIQDLLLVMTVADNSLQELASSVTHEDTQEAEGDRSSYIVPTGDSIIKLLVRAIRA